MSLTLHWISGSPFAWRVMWMLEYMSLPYTSRQLLLSKREHKLPEYLTLNPRGKVPTLQDGGTTIFESVAMLVYLDKEFGESNMFGANATESALTWQIISEVDNYLMPGIFGIVRPIFFGTGDLDPDAIEGHYSIARREMDLLEKRLSLSNYLVSERLNAADIVVMTTVQFLLRALSKQDSEPGANPFARLDRKYSNLMKWMQRMSKVKGYGASYPPHWRN